MREIIINWCPTKKMVDDFMTKPVQSSQFRELRDYIIGGVRCIEPKADVISLGRMKPSKKLVKKSNVNGKRRIPVTGNKSWAKVLAQKYWYHCTTGVCWGYIVYAESDDLLVDVLPEGSLEVDVLLVCAGRLHLGVSFCGRYGCRMRGWNFPSQQWEDGVSCPIKIPHVFTPYLSRSKTWTNPKKNCYSIINLLLVQFDLSIVSFLYVC